MKKKFIMSAIVSLLFMGCGTSDKSNDTTSSQTTPNLDTNGNMSFEDIDKKYTELALITRATREFCDNNEISSFIQNSSKISNYFLGIVNSRTLECSDLGKTVDHCDEYIAENESGNATCIIAFNLR
jgi:hypothetical protein